ncbi:hypothetical protein [Arthrobacter castelli]|uniref:hypothetical protein n=1 Tax=Arthrobacter castelli TaxID=271431 RepID=UPI0004214676|nr:hypothetical protein [Arthrobacter castelli]
MNGTPRTWNRVLLAIIGLILLGVGALAMALAMIPAVARWWYDAAGWIQAQLHPLFESTTLQGQRDSWLWIVLAFLTVLLVIAMIAWAANQGKGRSSDFAGDFGTDREGGRVLINGSVPEQAIKTALAERTDLVNSITATYRAKGISTLRIRLFPRSGVAPYTLAEDVTEVVLALDMAVGLDTPVLISMSAGARSRFFRAERVR